MPSPDASINWHYSNHSYPHTQRHKHPRPPSQPHHHPNMSPYTHFIVSRSSHHLNSLLAESAHISSHLLTLFPAGYCWWGPPCPTLHVQPLFSTQRLDFHSGKGAHTLLQHNRSFLPLPYSVHCFQRQTVSYKESPGKLLLLQLTRTSIYFVPQFFTICFCYIRISLKLNSVGFPWKKVVVGAERERLFVAFNWRQPSFLLLFTANGHQNC